MNLSGPHTFASVPQVNAPRSVFNRTHGHKTTFDAGWLIPFYVDEALPGDTFNVDADLFARLATPIRPILDNLWLDVFFFAVPNRLLWSNWHKMMGERENPGDSIDFLVPTVTANFAALSLYDYMGVPTGIANTVITNLHGRAYNLIWNEWFRDENLQNRVTVDKGDGPDNVANYVLKKRGKRHDYFTSCLPWPQKANTATSLPLGTSAPVVAADTGIPTFRYAGSSVVAGQLQMSNANQSPHVPTMNNSGSVQAMKWEATKLEADLTAATAATINQLREAFMIQGLLERDARGGTRYTEILLAHFGVVSPDQRMQRPEFLGGGSVPVTINPVTQTAPKATADAQQTPQGNMAAYGVMGGNVGFTKSFTEHCVILGLCMLRAELSYQQGLHKMWSRRTRYDFYWPSLAHLGEQAVLNKEIYFAGNGAAGDDLVFGYQERWAEYRHKPSLITGQFRSTHATTLDSWHLGQKFLSLPALNSTFIEEDPPLDRVIAVPSEPHVLFDSVIGIRCARPLPTYSVPGLGNRF